VFNVVNGDKEAVDALLADPRVQAVSFVGSTPIAEYVYATGTRTASACRRWAAPRTTCVVMPDADIDKAVSALMGAAYGSCGERCMAISVAVAVGDASADALVAALKPRVAPQGRPGSTAGMDMGPLVTRAHSRSVRGYVDLGVQEGASWWSTAAASRCRGTRRASSSAAACSTA
jgi:malonate-semialdehyde dehydrogenase (acetylating)/methylmalonate-semialdehyde dehydrogenase